MLNSELTLELPAEEIDFLKAYAHQHGTTIADLMLQYAKALRNSPTRLPHPANVQMTGKVPDDVDAREVYLQHVLERHG